MKTFAGHPVMLEDADLDHVTGGQSVTVSGAFASNFGNNTNWGSITGQDNVFGDNKNKGNIVGQSTLSNNVVYN